jgi:hypothetical protein
MAWNPSAGRGYLAGVFTFNMATRRARMAASMPPGRAGQDKAISSKPLRSRNPGARRRNLPPGLPSSAF